MKQIIDAVINADWRGDLSCSKHVAYAVSISTRCSCRLSNGQQSNCIQTASA